MPDASTPHRLVVAGDILIDHHLYSGDRKSPAVHNRRGVYQITECGGAHLLHRLIDRILKLDVARKHDGGSDWIAELGVEPPSADITPVGHDGYAIWKPHHQRTDSRPGTPLVWRADPDQLMGYGHLNASELDGLVAPATRAVPAANLLVLDDAGFLFRHATNHGAWPRADGGDGYVLLKMSEPVAQGALWRHLVEHCADRLVCLVSARDLRRERLGLGRGLSWEATVEDLHAALHEHPAARDLLKAQHLVVTFSADGALWLDLTDKEKPQAHLCCDPVHAEGEWERQFPGGALGYHCAMAAALAIELAAPRAGTKTFDLKPALEAGLLAMRDLKQHGHGVVSDETLPTGYPIDRIATKILDTLDGKLEPRDRLARIGVAWPSTPGGISPGWSIVEASQRPAGSPRHHNLLGLAWQIAQNGTNVLDGLPHARFGKLVTAERGEIETLRHIRQRMFVYHATENPKRPLSIGVFGPPGAGKSFGVRQLAEEVFGEKSWREFNLSQFEGSAELNGAFHQVRDLALSGLTPVVFWDEFDSRSLYWLRYLLAPMQDGRFQDEQLNHAIGKCVFVFAGGTSWSLDAFTPAKDDLAATRAFGLSKGPDFVSRLDAHLDVLGPNPRASKQGNDVIVDPGDFGFPLRRALLIRAALGCGPSDYVDFDPDLLYALLSVSKYHHGARSLEKLMEMLRGDDARVIRRSSLPRPTQLDMYVDQKEFLRQMRTMAGGFTALDDSDAVEEVAEAIHETWRALAAKEGWSMQPQFDKPYKELDEEAKEDNRAAARRIPEILALAGLGLRRNGEGTEPTVPDAELQELLKQHLNAMAEAEHNGWMFQRLRNGWRYAATRDDARKLHPAIVPFTTLPDREQNKDRDSVRHYPEFAKRANRHIVRLI